MPAMLAVAGSGLCNPYLVGAAGRRHPSKVASTLHGYCVRWKGGMWCIWVEMPAMCDEMCHESVSQMVGEGCGGKV